MLGHSINFDMKNYFLIFTTIQLLALDISYSSPETSSATIQVGIRGRWQTGNLNQIALNPAASLTILQPRFEFDLRGYYQFLRVNGFTAISDFWSSATYRHEAPHRFFPLIATNYGFAKSYKIDHSLLFGAGFGINLYRSSATSFFRLQFFSGYMNFKFENREPHVAVAFGNAAILAIPLQERINISWELHTYHSGKDSQFWGANNQLAIHYRVFKSLSVNLNHSTIFNKKTVENIHKSNTLLLFGIQYKFIKNNSQRR